MKRIISLMIISLILFLSSCTNTLVVQYSSPIIALDTVIDITFYNVDNYEEHYQKVKNIYLEVDRVADDFETNYNKTSLYDLNINRSIEGSDLLINLIKEAVELKSKTNGYYNPFIGRLSHKWKDAIDTGIIPTEDEVNLEIDIMNNTSVLIEGNTITLVGEGNLDLGGVAKGYATQKAYEYLSENNITSYLLNAGQSNIIAGDKNGKAITLGLNNPNDNNKVFKKLKGKNIIIATSSHQYQGIEVDGEFYHHVINPFTGYPDNYYDSVSVLCDNSMYADAYSTAFFAMNIEEIKSFIGQVEVDVILFNDDKIVYETVGDEYYE